MPNTARTRILYVQKNWLLRKMKPGAKLAWALLISLEINLKATDFKRRPSGRTRIYDTPPPAPNMENIDILWCRRSHSYTLQGLYMIFIINQPYLISLSSNSYSTDYYPEGWLLNWYLQEWINSVENHWDKKRKRRTPSAQCMFNENSSNKMIDIVWLLYAIQLYEEN